MERRSGRALDDLAVAELFAGCTRAELQRALVVEEWPGSLALRTRVALHTGEAALRDGDYYGGTLNPAARIRSLAA